MASIDLAEYKRQLDADPEAPNQGPWFAKSNINHNGKSFVPGARLPEMKNSEVSQLLEVNVLTSVNPNPESAQEPTQSPEEQEQARIAEEQRRAAEQNPDGQGRIDANGNPIQ